jgi:beta-phosphoglucomutase-like phosphatase (HAD superfamily)
MLSSTDGSTHNGAHTTSTSSTSRKLKAILFDVDGTMADTDVFHRRVYKDLLKPFNIDCTDEFYNQRLSGKLNQQLHKELVPHLSDEEAKALFTGPTHPA